MASATRDEILSKVRTVPFWWHSIDLGQGVVTPGKKTEQGLKRELGALHLPNLSGKSVLDIGAWDGFYSFEAERRGAASVVALDHYVWSMDVPAMMEYWNDCKRKGVVPKQYDEVPGMWQPDRLPGKRGFDVAHGAIGSKVTPIVADFTTMELDTLGVFDVTLYLGVLYHMHDPFRCLKRLARVTRELAVIETSAIHVPGHANAPLWEFYEGSELDGDVNNWWAPSEAGLLGMCRAAGFSKAVSLTGPSHEGMSSAVADVVRSRLGFAKEPVRYRLIVHAFK